MIRSFNSIFNWLLWRIGSYLPKSTDGAGICIIRTDLIGDFILFTPALRGIRQKYAGARITIVVKKIVAPLLRSCPYVDEVIVLDENRFRRRPDYRLSFLLRMRRMRSSEVIYACYSRNYPGDLAALWTAAPVRVAWDSQSSHLSAGEKRRGDRIYTQLVPGRFGPEVHETARNTALLIALGSAAPATEPEFWPDAEADTEAARLLREGNLENKKFIVILSGASFGLKNWGGQNYLQLCLRLLRDITGLHAVLCGQEGDAFDLRTLSMEMAGRVSDLTGRTNLPTLAGIFRRSALVVGNDTGTMHIAIAMNVPTVCIVGGGHFGRFMPYGDRERHVFLHHPLPCYHCDWNCIYESAVCISAISVETAFQACKSFVAEATRQTSFPSCGQNK